MSGLLIGVIIVVVYFGRYAYMSYQYGGDFTLLPVILKTEHRAYLEKYFSYYVQLPPQSKKIFEKRVAYFMESKEFVPREMIAVSWEMQVLISAAAIQLTFGFPKVYLSHFEYILVYPNKFFSRSTQTFNQGEVNPRAKSIVIGWKFFVEGYLKNDGRNLGLHEMSHALRLENRIMNEEFNFLDKDLLHSWELRATNTMLEIKEGRETFFREYGATDREEFFAVAVENFFERPVEFAEKHPLTYQTLCKLLRQDPQLLVS
jgi:Mlc titration factor MtfA (ptsG expression regulator)